MPSPSRSALRRALRPSSAAAALLLALATPALAHAQQADLVLNLGDTPDPAPVGGIVTYAVTVANDAPTTATTVRFTLAVPGNARYDGVAGAGVACSGMAANAVGPGTLTCTLPDLAFNATVGFSVRLRSTAVGLVTVAGEVTSAVPELQASNNTVVETTTIISGADVRLDVAAPASAASGSLGSYALSIANAGPDAATALRVQLPIPTGFAVTAALPGGCASAAGTITCDVAGPIAAGATHAIGSVTGQFTVAAGSTVSGTASVAVAPGAPPGTAQDPNAADNTATFGTSITGGSDVRLTVARGGSAPFLVGADIAFTIAAQYTGDAPTSLTITDTLPANYAIRTAALAATQGAWSCGAAGQVVTCTRAAGGAAGTNQSLGSVTIPVTIASPGANVQNVATIHAAAPADPDPSNNRASDTPVTLQNPYADLALAKSAPSPALAVVGQPFAYTLRVTNGGPSRFHGTLVVTDHLPAGLTFDGFAGTGWTCTPVGVAGPVDVECRRTYTSGSSMATGGGGAATLTLTVTPTADGAITNTASLATENPNVEDPNPSNGSASAGVGTSQPAGAADLRLLASVDVDPVPAGEQLAHTLEIVNDGPVAATSLTVVDTLANLINGSTGAANGVVSVTATNGAAVGTITCGTAANGANGRIATCTVPSLPPCTAGVDCPTIRLVVRPGGSAGTRTNRARVISSATADPALANNTGSVSHEVLSRADVRVAVTGSPDPVAAGQELAYVVTAANAGPSQATGVATTSTLPQGVVFLSATPSAGSCGTTPAAGAVTTGGDRTVACALGAIPNGAQQTVTIRVKPTTATRGTTLTHDAAVATATTQPADADPANDAASTTTAVAVPALDLVVNRTDAVDPLTIGDVTTYTVTVTNAGPSDAEGVVITDAAPPAGLSYQAHAISSGSCAAVPAVDEVGGTLSCQVARIASGATVTLTIQMRGVTKGVHTGAATVASDESALGFENVGNNTATQATTVRTRADVEVVSKTPSAATVAVRRPFTWTIRVRNNAGPGLAEADSVHVDDALPAGMELVGAPSVTVVVGTVSASACSGVAGETSFRCDLGTMSAGAELDVVVPVRMLAVPVGGSVENTATIGTASMDIAIANGSTTGSVAVEGSSLAGLVFRDFDADGAPDAEDTGMQGIAIALAGTAFDGSAVSRNATTDADGGFAFADLPEGTYALQRGAAGSALLLVGAQTAGDRGGDAATAPHVTGIALGERDAGAGYRFAFVPQARIGATKRLNAAIAANADGSFTAVANVVVRSYSLEPLAGVVVTDQVAGAAPRFGAYVAGGAGAALVPGSYTVHGAPSFPSACAGGTANAGFDGDGDVQLAQVATLAPGASCTVRFTIRYMPNVPLPGGGHANQARVAATGAHSGQTPSDLSHNTANADQNGDGDPTNDDGATAYPTTLTADVTTAVTLPGPVDAGHEVAGAVVFRNVGPYAASAATYALTLTPGLAGVAFDNLPAGASATYAAGTGVVTLAGMPATLAAGAIASGDGVAGIAVRWTQPGAATSAATSTIGTSTSQGANANPNTATATVTGALVADVATALAMPASVDAGETVQGVVTFRNAGPSVASGMAYGATLTPGLAGVAFGNLPGGASAHYDAATGAVSFASMPATLAAGAIASGNGTSGITVRWTQTPTASSAAASTIGTSTGQDANAAPDAASATVGGALVADVATALAFPASADAGDAVSGAATFRNAGPSVASGVTYALTLDAGLAGVTFGNLPAGASAHYDAATGAVGFTNMPATLAAGAIASGDGVAGIAVGYVQPADAVSTVASGIGTSTGQGANALLDAASASPGGVPVADVRAHVVLPASVDAGEPVRAAVRWTNLGPSRADAVTYALALPAGLAGATVGNLPAGAAASYDAATGAVTLTGMPDTLAAGALASGDGVEPVTVDYAQPATATSTVGATIGTATAQGANVAPDASTATVGGALVADVAAAVAAPADATVGATVAATVLFRNGGPSVASGVTYALALDAGLAGVAFGNLPGGASAHYDAATGAVGFTSMPATLAAGAVASGDGVAGIAVAYAQPHGTAGSRVEATIATTTGQGANAAADLAAATVGGVVADLAVATSTAATFAQLGDSVAYRVRVENHGPRDVPAGSRLRIAPTDLAPLGAACAAGTACAAAPDLADLLAGAALPALPSGAAYELVVEARVAVAGGAIATRATVAVAPGYVDPDAANDEAATAPLAVHLGPDLSIARSTVGAVFPGGRFEYALTVGNAGTAPTDGAITVTDELPPALAFLAGDGDGWACAAAGRTVTCGRTAPLAVDAATTIAVAVRVADDAAGTLDATATVATPNDGRRGRKLAAAATALVAGPDLALTRTADTDTLRVSGAVTYTLRVRNAGTAPTSDALVVADTLPAGLVPTTAAGDGFACTIEGQAVGCTHAAAGVAPGEERAVAITASVVPAVGMGPVATAGCVRTPGDADPSNDCGALSLPVTGLGALTIRKELVGEVVVGLPARFDLWVRNDESVAAPGPIHVADTLPTGFDATSATGDGWTCEVRGAVVDCARERPIAAGDSTAIALVAAVGRLAAPELELCATVSATDAAVVPGGERSCTTVRTVADYRMTLELATPHAERELGDMPDFTLVVRNVGASPLPAATVTAWLPRGFTYLPGTSRRDGARADDPAIAANAATWALGTLEPDAVVRLRYRAAIGAGARLDGENVTRALAVSAEPGVDAASNEARAAIRLRAGVFADRGIVAGTVVAAGDSTLDATRATGVPGVRVILEDGTAAVTDEEGKYSLVDVRAGLHVVKVDPTTLPAGARLVALDVRNAGDAGSRFVDLKRGELARADFVLDAADAAVRDSVVARRAAAPPTALAGAAGDAFGDARALGLAAPAGPATLGGTRYVPLLPPGLPAQEVADLARGTPGAALRSGGAVVPATMQGALGPAMLGATVATRAATAVAAGGGTVAGVPAAPVERPLVAAGLLQARVDLRTGRASARDDAFGDAFEEALTTIRATFDSGRVVAGARAAVYARGTVKGLGLLTLGFDSERDRRLAQFRDVQPDAFFPVYGDASVREFDAQSRERLYLRVDRGAQVLRYGDFVTPRADDRRLLLAFDRSLTGLQHHVEGARGALSTFVSEGRSRQRVDEIAGRGLSGPYRLGRADVVPNSERVELVTRDRNQPAVILERRPMARFTDYTIEPGTDRLVFRAPVPSLDANLNPVSVRVTYEVEDGGERRVTYGADGTLRLGRRVEVGALVARDDDPLDGQTVLGGAATVALGAGTHLLGEVARSEMAADDAAGDAWRVELRHRSARLEGRAYAVRGDSAFDNPSSPFVGGRAEYGARWIATLDSSTRLLAEALRTEDVRTDGRRDGVSLALERRLARALVAELGWRWADETARPATAATQGIAPIALQTARARLTAQVPGSARSSVFAEYEVAVDGADARRGMVGADHRLLDRARLYGRHEWISSLAGPYALNDAQERQQTVVGVDAEWLGDGQAFSEYRARDAFGGRDAEAAIGLRNRWPIRPGVTAHTSFERVAPLEGEGTGRALAVTGALELTGSPLWKGTARAEWRTSDAGEDYLGSLGVARKLSRDWTALGRTQWDQRQGDAVRGRSQLGLAWRETGRNRVNALFRVENVLDRTDAADAPTERSVSNVAAALVNVQPYAGFTLSARYAAKLATDRRDGLESRTTGQLVMGRVTHDLTSRLDVGVMGSVLGDGGFGARRYGAGAELGAVVMRNLRLAGGYNVFGFADRDFASLGATRRGPYVEIGFKFDETLLGGARP